MKESDYNSIRVNELVQGIERVVRGTDSPDKLKSLLLVPDKFLKSQTLVHDSKHYYSTGKVGNRMSDGMMGREFKNLSDNMDSRVWLYRDGTVAED